MSILIFLNYSNFKNTLFFSAVLEPFFLSYLLFFAFEQPSLSCPLTRMYSFLTMNQFLRAKKKKNWKLVENFITYRTATQSNNGIKAKLPERGVIAGSIWWCWCCWTTWVPICGFLLIWGVRLACWRGLELSPPVVDEPCNCFSTASVIEDSYNFKIC